MLCIKSFQTMWPGTHLQFTKPDNCRQIPTNPGNSTKNTMCLEVLARSAEIKFWAKPMKNCIQTAAKFLQSGQIKCRVSAAVRPAAANAGTSSQPHPAPPPPCTAAARVCQVAPPLENPFYFLCVYPLGTAWEYSYDCATGFLSARLGRVSEHTDLNATKCARHSMPIILPSRFDMCKLQPSGRCHVFLQNLHKPQ